jgi:hypothetical protein
MCVEVELSATVENHSNVGNTMTIPSKQADIEIVVVARELSYELFVAGVVHMMSFKNSGATADLENSVTNFRIAAALIDDGHPDKPARLSCLGASQGSRFTHLGQLNDLHNSVLNHGKAVQLSHNKPVYLSDLGMSQFTRFKRLGALTDIDDSVLNLSKAVCGTEDSNPDKATYLSNLGICLVSRFQRLGKLHDLTQSLSNLHTAVNLCDNGHVEKQ